MTVSRFTRAGAAAAVLVTAGLLTAAAAVGRHDGAGPAALVSGYMRGTVTVQWSPVAGASGYRLVRDGKTVATASAAASSTRFSVVAGTHTLAAYPATVTATTAPATTTTTTTTSAGSVAWLGDFQTGNTTQWAGVQQKAAGRVSVVQSPFGAGYAARFEVQPGDALSPGAGERAEVLTSQANTDGYDGHQAWWAFSAWFDPSFAPTVVDWNIFAQFHNLAGYGQPNAYFAANGNTLRFVVCNGAVESSPSCKAKFTLDPARVNGRRYDFVLHVEWSSDPAQGFVEVWENGRLVLPLARLQTLYANDPGVYLKQGYYRQPQQTTAIVFQAGMRRASSYAAAIAGFPAGTWPATAP